MFRNGPEVDGGDIAYLRPTTIIEMTIPMSQSSSDAILDDSWVLAGPIRHKLLNTRWVILMGNNNTNLKEVTLAPRSKQ